MTDEKVNEVLDRYEIEVIYSSADPNLRAGLKIQDMIPQIRNFLKNGRREKAMRWLGFIQGALWREDQYTVEQLKDHNRSDKC